MAGDENMQHSKDSIKGKRSSHWELEETEKLVIKWGEDNIQERQKFFGFLLNEKQGINSLDGYICMKRSWAFFEKCLLLHDFLWMPSVRS